MLVRDVGDEMCWRQDVGDVFRRFVGHQQPIDLTNIEILSRTFKNCHQDKVTNISVA